MEFVSYIDKFDKKKKGFVCTNAGDPIAKTYEYQLVDGIQTLVPTGEVNIQEQIDSYAESCDIHNIIARFLNGETDLLSQKDGVYADARRMPENYVDLFNRVNDCKKYFDDLPIGLRERFDHSYEKFWSMFGTEEFDSLVQGFYESPDDIVNITPVSDVQDLKVEGGISNAE